MTAPVDPPRRGIRSFVLRAGRITDAQRRALEELWPRYGIDAPVGAAGPLDLDRQFGRSAALTVEIGFGNGENLAALAAAHPERNYLGIEVHRPGVGRLMLQAEQHQLQNLRIATHDAVEVLQRWLAAGSIDELLILFPDPWHKARHHKRRLIQPAFAELAAGRLRRDGQLKLATDWQPYAEHMLEVLNACPALRNLSADATYVARPEWRIETRFERRGARLGHSVWDLAYVKR